MKISDWGKYPYVDTNFETPRDELNAQDFIQRCDSLIARGKGLCYGDSALNDNLILSSQKLNRMLSFDPTNGLLIAEAGVTLAEILDCFCPLGWFLPVTPGTKLITLGGAIGSDVHGKNHHVAETFGHNVEWIEIITSEQGLVRCSATQNADLFWASCGGHGLTGFIVRVALRLIKIPSVWIKQTSIKTQNLHEIMNAFESYAHSPLSVAWIDCLKGGDKLGRSILTCGDFAQLEDLQALAPKKRSAPYTTAKSIKLAVPFDFPSFALNSLSVSAFNMLYYGKAPKGTVQNIVSYNSFFYPLDAIHNWNKIYGKKGFTQYQFVLPLESSKEGLAKILTRISQSGLGSFLAVLKLFGKQSEHYGNISFPKEGYTLALDFPISQKLFPLLNELDSMVLDYEGRIYLTKDVRMSAVTFKKGYAKHLEEFLTVKHKWDSKNKFTSLQAKRLNLI